MNAGTFMYVPYTNSNHEKAAELAAQEGSYAPIVFLAVMLFVFNVVFYILAKAEDEAKK